MFVKTKSSRSGTGEAHLPAEQPPSRQEARVPPPDEHPRRAGDPEVAPRPRPPQAVGLIWAIRERASFDRLRAEGRRVDVGALWCSVVLDPDLQRPRVAFAIGRSFGSAVARNRMRRRLRPILASRAARLAPGLYLIGARPIATRRTHDELATMIDTMLERIETRR
jgi:ribonuclease P protein component